MNRVPQSCAVLTVLTALAAEAKALVRTRRYTGEGDTFVVWPPALKGRSIAVIQCGMGSDAVLRVASRPAPGSILGSIGVSGGLDPGLAPGAVILGDHIRTHGDHRAALRAAYTPSAGLLDLLESALTENALLYRRGGLLCVPQPLASPDLKAAAHLETGALAVDMESAGAAEVARRRGLPFFCIRIVCDPVGRRTDKRLLVGVDRRGSRRPLRLIKPLIRRPWLVGRLSLMASDFSRAVRSMGLVWDSIHPSLAAVAGDRLGVVQK